MELLQLVLIYLLTISILIFLILKWNFSYWTRRGIFQISPNYLFGNIKGMALKTVHPSDLFRNCYNEFKKAGVTHGGIYIMQRPVWFPIDVDLIKQMITKDFNHFNAHGYYFQHENDILSNHLFSIEGEKWKTVRTKLAPAFSNAKLKVMFKIMTSVGERLEAQVESCWTQGKILNMKDITKRYTTDIIANCFFGIECNSLENPNIHFREFGEKIFVDRMFYTLLSHFFNWRIMGFFGFKLLGKEHNEYYENLVKGVLDSREKTNLRRNDFIDALVELAKEEKNNKNNNTNFGFSDIVANVFVTYAAGFESSATTLSFIISELARNPDIQEKVRAEIWKVSKYEETNEINFDDLKQLKYCEMVINETLRLHTVFPNIARVCTKNYLIPGTNVTIEKRTALIIPCWAIHMDKEHNPNPEIFNPENFSEENKLKRRDLTFFPFGNGPRTCIGQMVAYSMIKLAMVKLFKNFKYELNENTPKNIEYDYGDIVRFIKGDALMDVTKVDVQLYNKN